MEGKDIKKKFFTPDKIVCYIMSLLVIVAATAAVIMIVRTSICDAQENDFPEEKPVVLKSKKTQRHPLARGVHVSVEFYLTETDLSLTLDTDESYSLSIAKASGGEGINVKIHAVTYFGLRHGLESLGQLIVYDELQFRYKMPGKVEIVDRPVYRHRGLLLDTVRQFYSVKSIKRTIDAMAMVKLNVFHWHITDANSYPMKLQNFQEMARIGAYGPKEVYSVEDIREVVRFAKIRGIRVMPEYDAPAHVAEGWQFTDFVTCYNAQPWDQFCAGPPCGQLDPTRADLYDVLEGIYDEMNELFDQPDLFHMGGDEVYPSCWNISSHVQQWMMDRGWGVEREDFVELWNHFQTLAHERLKKVAPKTRAVLWTGTLTEANFVERFLPPEDYVIQVWTEGSGTGSHIPHLLAGGYDLIISNTDALYLDCGFGSYVGEGVNWCSPYKPWTKMYNNNITAMGGERHGQILGAEACSWSSISGEPGIDSRLWPRLSALAERLWTDPDTDFRAVERRILLHRRDLVNFGINAESIQPGWCLHNPSYCVR
uniref:Beta-hexosaminidase n=1 Tax=Phlebotomus papatasi TaxID=29031 RepID=A0A1B0D7A1_PHLPP